MANGSKHGGIEGADKSAKATVGAGVAIAGGIAAALVGTAISKQKAEQERQAQIAEIKNKIADIDRQIARLRGEFLGTYRYSSDIEQFERLRGEYQAKLNKLIRG